MSNAAREQMKEEAIARMELLHIHPNCIDDFKQADLVSYSRYGILCWWITDEQQNRVQEFEKQSGNLVYHVIDDHYVQLGRMLTLLYVSPYMGEWERDRKELEAGEPLVYVANLSDEICSEYGHVRIVSSNDGLRSTW